MVHCSGSSIGITRAYIPWQAMKHNTKYKSGNMTENKYKSTRIIDGKPRQIIVDENGKIIKRNPTKEELKGLDKEPYKYIRKFGIYTDKELLEYLVQFYKENGRPPKLVDFINNPKYPGNRTYYDRFGGWQKALQNVGLDTESTVKNGIIENDIQKGRLAEIIVRDHFKTNPIDLAGENKNSYCDGICPNGKIYDVKSSKFNGIYWHFRAKNKYKEEIEIYYLLAFNEDYTKLMYAWRVPGEMIDRDSIHVGTNSSHRKFTIENMKEYDITERLTEKLPNRLK